MRLCVTIKPGLHPEDRFTLEDLVCEALGEDAELVGGGTLVGEDGALLESDFDVQLPLLMDGARAVEIARAELDRISFTQPTTIDVRVSEDDFGALDEDVDDDA